MKKARLTVSILAVLGLFSVGGSSAHASHSWESYHWSRSANPVSLEVVDSMVGEWDSYLPLVSQDWTASSVIDTTVVAGADSIVDRTLCLPISGKVRACNAMYADVTWLGLATVWLDGDHIVQATTQVNDTWFNTSLYNDPSAKRHVLCQEIGHDFGLDHQYTEPSCMDDTNGLFDPAFISPGAHDYQQLDLIYQHLDGSGSPQEKTCKGKGKGCNKPSSGPSGGSSTVRVFYEDGLTVVQYILWAQPGFTPQNFV